jgi:hypothetical protein
VRGGRLAAAATDRWRAEAAILLVYAIALALLLMRHEMWRDELQAWLIARDSGSLLALWRNTRLEGHPLLWHVLLWLVARVTSAPAAMQLLHFFVALGGAFVLVRFAPFALWQRAALVLGYFSLFEYGVISRNYALSCLGIWIACAAAAANRGGAWGPAGVVLAANSSPMGVLLTPALATAVCAGTPERRARWRGAVVMGLGAALAAVQAWPTTGYEHAHAWVLGYDPPRVAYVLRHFAAVLLYLPTPSLHFWNTSLIFGAPASAQDLDPARTVLAVALVAAAVLGVAWLLRRLQALVVTWLLGAGALLGFAYVKFPGAVRHQGFLVILLIAVLWLGARWGITGRTAAAVVGVVAVLGCLSSAVAAYWDWRAPFSGAERAAHEVRARGLDRLPLVGGVDFAASGVAAFLPGTRLYYPSRGEWGTFMKWDFIRLRQDRMTPAEIVHGALSVDRGEGVVLLVNEALPTGTPCRLEFAGTPTIVVDEEIWGYRCGRAK